MDVKLVMFKANGQRKDFPIINDGVVIGRAENCDLRIPLLSVSRRHCELIVAGDEVKARDLASSNGTYVNNKRVNEQTLQAGDRLVIGPIVFTVQIDGQPEEIRPVKTKGQRLAERGPAAPKRPAATPAPAMAAEDEFDIDAELAAEIDLEGSTMGGSTFGRMETKAGEPLGIDDPLAALESLGLDEEDQGKGKQ